MRIRSSLLVAALAVAAAAAGAAPAAAIKGGTESAEPYAFMGSLQREGGERPDDHVCGVVVLAPRWVLSASHCARSPNLAPVGTPRGWRVRIGSLATTTGGEVAEVDRFYRLATESEGFFGRDLSLLHLRTPVRAAPVRLATGTPPDHTPARILGWGMTCDDRADPACHPDRLREADTEVQPDALCPPLIPDAELCVGSPDGSVAAANMDSGGPALVRDGDEWVVAGVLSGGETDTPSYYTDVSRHLAWVEGIVTGTDVPPEVPMPSLEGVVDLTSCVGAVVRTPTARREDPALMLTNGHCVAGDHPAPGAALVDRPADREVPIADREGYPQTTARAVRLVYATMTGTDIALYRLNRTYAQLAAAGAKVFDLTATPATAGTPVDAFTGARRLSCTVEAVVPHLREDGYRLDRSLRYASGCGLGPGNSGSPLIAADGRTVVGIHNTSNRDGERCTAGNPCEVAADGSVISVRGRAYGQQVSAIARCFHGSKPVLSRPGCTLPGRRG
jgi:hypothetical protein